MADAKKRADQLFNFIETDATEKAIDILEEKVDFSVIKNGYNLIHLAARSGMKDIVEKLIRKGMPASSKNENGNSAMHYAAREGHLDIVELLVNNGVDANIDNQDGNTALHIASKFHTMHVIERLINIGMNVNNQNGKGETPLHVAVMHNRQEAMQALLMNGAKPALKDKSGKMPEAYAKDPDLARQIRTYSELPVALQSGYIVAEEIQICPKTAKTPLKMARAGVTISKLDTKADLPVLLYCGREKPENRSIKFLLEKGDEIVSDIFQIRVNDCSNNVKILVKIPLYVKISKKEEIIVKFKNGATSEFQEMEEHSDITYCPLQLDMNPGSQEELVVLSRPKQEEYTVGADGSSIHSKMDENFVIDIPPGTFNEDTKLAMKVYETRESQQLAEEGKKMTSKNADKRGSANRVLLTDIFQISIEGKQPTKKVAIRIPSYEEFPKKENLDEKKSKKYLKRNKGERPFCFVTTEKNKVKSDDIVIVTADEKHLMDDTFLKIIPTKPKHHKGNIIFEVEHFSIFVGAPKTPKLLNHVAPLIAASLGRKRPYVFFCMMQIVTIDEYLAIVECTTMENSRERREFWRGNGFMEQNMTESGTLMFEPSQEFQAIFSGNIKVIGDTGQKRLIALRNKTSFQLYRISLIEGQKATGGVIDILKIVRDDDDGSKTDVHVTSLPVKLENIQKGSSTGSINYEKRFMILKPESLKVLGQALTRTQGKQLGTRLGLDLDTIRRIRLESPNSGYANYKIIEMWINKATDWWSNVSESTETTLINELTAIGRQSLADVLIRIKEKDRVLRGDDFKDS